MKYIGKKIDKTEYKLFEIYSKINAIEIYIRINIEDDTSRKNKNLFFLKKNKWNDVAHIGEILGYLIAKKIGFKTCDVEPYREYRCKTYYDVGVISYVEKSKDDKLYTPSHIIGEYRKAQNINEKDTWITDIETIFASVFKFMQSKNRPYQEYLDFKQDFINTMIFDIKLLNADRGLDNWLIREEKKTGKIDMYPMFDNAAIVGFERGVIEKDKQNIESYEKKIRDYDNQRVIPIILPATRIKNNGTEKKSISSENYKDFLKYLLQKYPKETRKALLESSQFTSQDLREYLDTISPENTETDIPEERIEFAIDLFKTRENGMKEVIKKFETERQMKSK